MEGGPLANALFAPMDIATCVAAAGVNPLDHYHQNGWIEGATVEADLNPVLSDVRRHDLPAFPAGGNHEPLAVRRRDVGVRAKFRPRRPWTS
jgi:hypothetical protein